MVLPGCENRLGETISQLIKDEVNRLESKISRFIPESSISVINRFAAEYPVKLDEELWNILIECREYNKISLGAFDLALRVIGDYWNANNSSDCMQPELTDTALSLLSRAGFKNIEFNKDDFSLFFKNREIELDLGSVGKGIALRNIDSILDRNGIESAFVSFGESSLLCRGNHPNGTEWKIGIPDTYNENQNGYTLGLKDRSLSVSGNTMNNKIPGRTNIINPFNGLPVTEMKTIVVADKNPVLAEAFSTAFMVLNDEQIIAILKEHPAVKAVKIEYYKEKTPAVTEYTANILN